MDSASFGLFGFESVGLVLIAPGTASLQDWEF